MDQIVQEVKIIRKYITITSIVIIIAVMLQIIGSLAVLSFVLYSKDLINKKTQSAGYLGKEFKEQVYEKIYTGDYAAVIKLAEERQKKYPKDPYVYYFLGQAYQGMGNHQKALENFEKAQDMAPSWKGDYTGPLIKKSKEALGMPAGKDQR